MVKRSMAWLVACGLLVVVAQAGLWAANKATDQPLKSPGKEAVRLAEAKKTSCTDSAAGPLVAQAQQGGGAAATAAPALPVLARVGQEAPDFEAMGYYQGDFVKVKLSDYRGKWVVLCFYPADFTFV